MNTWLSKLGALVEFLTTSRVGAVFDKSAWLLMAPAFAALYAIDPAMAMTLVQWTVFGLVLSGAAIIISRIVFPQINIEKLVSEAHDENNTAAGIIVGAVVLFVGLVMLSLVLWAKA